LTYHIFSEEPRNAESIRFLATSLRHDKDDFTSILRLLQLSTNLRHLQILPSVHLGGIGEISIPSGFWNGSFNNVVTLDIRMSPRVLSKFRLEEIPFPSLRNLHFGVLYPQGLLAKIAEGVAGAPAEYLDKHLLPVIRCNAQQLQHLSLSLWGRSASCDFSDSFRLLPKLPKLKQLALHTGFDFERPKLLDIEPSGIVRNLVVECLPKLEEFSFSFTSIYPVLDHDAPFPWSTQVPHLTSLKLGVQFNLTEPFFMFIQENLPRLRTLWIVNNNWQHDDETRLLTIAQKMNDNAVQDLMISSKVWDLQSLKALQSAFPKLHCLRVLHWQREGGDEYTFSLLHEVLLIDCVVISIL
jgi:hypothetical protein